MIGQKHTQIIKTSGRSWQRHRYKEIMYGMYARYEDHLNRLTKKYSQASHIRFHNITDLFPSISKPMYLDMIHYNELGNKILAQQLQEDIMKLLAQMQNSNDRN